MNRIVAVLIATVGLAVLHSPPAAAQDGTQPLLSKILTDIPGKEVVMLTVEYAPGQASQPHRHNADTFVYVLEGAVMMGVKGGKTVRVEAGQTFYESPTDIHTISRNASSTAPAKFLVFFIKDQGAPALVPANG